MDIVSHKDEYGVIGPFFCLSSGIQFPNKLYQKLIPVLQQQLVQQKGDRISCDCPALNPDPPTEVGSIAVPPV